MSYARHGLAITIFTVVVGFTLPAFAQGDEVPADKTPVVQAPDVKAEFQGKFVYAGGQKQRDKLVEAIEAATDDMNFVTRPIARSRLKDTNIVFQSLVVAFTADTVSVKRDSQTPIATPISGAKGTWTSPDDETYTVTQTLKDRKIVQTFVAGDGRKVATYTLSKDGKSLTLSISVSSPKLPQKVTYALSYRKS